MSSLLSASQKVAQCDELPFSSVPSQFANREQHPHMLGLQVAAADLQKASAVFAICISPAAVWSLPVSGWLLVHHPTTTALLQESSSLSVSNPSGYFSLFVPLEFSAEFEIRLVVPSWKHLFALPGSFYLCSSFFYLFKLLIFTLLISVWLRCQRYM